MNFYWQNIGWTRSGGVVVHGIGLRPPCPQNMKNDKFPLTLEPCRRIMSRRESNPTKTKRDIPSRHFAFRVLCQWGELRPRLRWRRRCDYGNVVCGWLSFLIEQNHAWNCDLDDFHDLSLVVWQVVVSIDSRRAQHSLNELQASQIACCQLHWHQRTKE